MANSRRVRESSLNMAARRVLVLVVVVFHRWLTKLEMETDLKTEQGFCKEQNHQKKKMQSYAFQKQTQAL